MVSLHLKSGEVKMTKDELKPFDPLKPVSVPKIMEACRENPVQFYIIDDFTAHAEYAEKMRLGERIQGVIDAYENATTPKQRYKAGSELCRLVDRIGDGTAVVQGIQNSDKRYIAHVRRDGEYRIPELQVVEGISPTQISMIEYNTLFPNKSISYPSYPNRTPMVLEEVLGRAVFLGVDDALAKAYDSVVKYNREFHRGVKKE